MAFGLFVAQIESVIVDASLCAAPNPNCNQAQNIGEQRNRGVELSADWLPLESLRLNAQASLIDRDNRSRPELRQTDTPEQKYRMALQWRPIAAWILKADAQHETKRFSTTDGSRVADAFTVVNAFVRYEPLPRLGLEAGARNLTDELYAYQEGFYEAGRTWLAQIDYRYAGATKKGRTVWSAPFLCRRGTGWFPRFGAPTRIRTGV